MSQIYTYRVYNKFSTKQSILMDEEGECRGYIRKTYNNFLERIIDLIGRGNFINRYEVLDSDEKMVFQSKRGNPFRWRKYYAEYFYEGDSFQFEMKQKDFIKVSDQTRFLFNGTYYDLKAEFGKWAVISEERSGKEIARWRMSYVAPVYANFEILDEGYRRHDLLFLGAFHTYLYGE